MQVNNERINQLLLERERLINPPQPTDQVTGVGIARFVVSSNDTQSVLELAKEVMIIVNNYSTGKWLSLNEWSNVLPPRFIECCLPELSEDEKREQAHKWSTLSYDEKIKEASEDDRWTLASWLSWLEPNERE
ncbi:hypothetical protein [Pantoea sp.]|uniref:hypothetical protein n=1 Tax=Pantoea sp. TaxID=69393 RepID=UPI0031D4EFF0